MSNQSLDSQWMELALKQALLAEQKGEVPVGAVLVKNNKLIAKAHNQPILNNDPTAHAEIQLLRKAGKILANYRNQQNPYASPGCVNNG
jgi:tRNA(adenine34) deaminase